jgi:Zn-dependent protease with chaperone function
MVSASFSDGRTASAQAVAVRHSGRGIVIEGMAPEGGDLVWPYGALASAVPLAADQQDVALAYDYAPGASLFVEDAAFVAELARHAPHLTTRATRWKAAKPWLALSAGIASIVMLVWLSGFSPARAVAGWIPKETRVKLGEQVIASMTRGKKTCAAPAGRAALDKLTARLVAASGKSVSFKVAVSDWKLLNAFAAPGEQIVLTREIVEKAKSADEVAAVLAHEMGHGLEMHPEAGIVRSLGFAAAIELMTGGTSGTLANLGLLMSQLSYTRAAEREADGHALAMLKAAGISPKGMVDFFERVAAIEGKSATGRAMGQFDILRTHPQSEERAKRAAGQPPYPVTPALDAADWEALKAICKV